MESYYKEIEYRFMMDAIAVNNNAKYKDGNRNYVCYGMCAAWGRILDDMGHESEIPVYEEDGFLKIPYLKVDGKKIIEF